MMKRAAFIGAGNMGGAIVKAVCKGCNPQEIAIYDPMREKAERLRDQTGCTVAKTVKEAALDAKYIFICVKPQVFQGVLGELLGEMEDNDTEHVIVSIAASIPIHSIEKILAGKQKTFPVIRLLPNTPVSVGYGLTLMTGNSDVTESDYRELAALLEPGGLVEYTDEHTMEVACPVYSCTPAFGSLFIEGLSDGGVQIGLPRDKAIRYAAQGILGAAALVLQSGQHPGQLKDAVCSPGGTTIVGVTTLEEYGVRYAAAKSILNAYQRMKGLET